MMLGNAQIIKVALGDVIITKIYLKDKIVYSASDSEI